MHIEVKDAEVESLLIRYYAVKNLMLLSEDADGELRANLQIYNELRSCLDHLMACFLEKCGAKGEEILDRAQGIVSREAEGETGESNSEREAVESARPLTSMASEGESVEDADRDDGEYDKNVSSALKHLDRAFFDACDFTYLSCKRLIVETVSSHSESDIRTAIPRYYSVIKPFLDELSTQTVQFRNARTQNTKDKEEIIANFASKMHSLQVYTKLVLDAGPTLSLLSSDRERQESMKFESRPSLFLALALGFVIGAATLIFLSGGPGQPIVETLRSIFGNMVSCLLV